MFGITMTQQLCHYCPKHDNVVLSYLSKIQYTCIWVILESDRYTLSYPRGQYISATSQAGSYCHLVKLQIYIAPLDMKGKGCICNFPS